MLNLEKILVIVYYNFMNDPFERIMICLYLQSNLHLKLNKDYISIYNLYVFQILGSSTLMFYYLTAIDYLPTLPACCLLGIC